MLKFVVLSISFILLSATAAVGILPEIRDSLGITQTQSELLITVPSITTLLFVILCDQFIGKIGMKKTVITGLLISGIGGIMPLFNDTNYTYFLISRFLFGAGKGLIFTPSVSYINVLFHEKERATLIGYRSATEMLGQSILTFTMGALVVFGWRFSFTANVVFFLIAGLVASKIPEVDANRNMGDSGHEMKRDQKKIPLIVYPLALFVGVVAISSSMIAIRFPAMATEIRGAGYNASFWVGLKPLLGIVAASFFGKLNGLLGKRVLYLGTFLLVVSQFLLGFSYGNFSMLIIGFLLSAFVLGWIVPVIINVISKLTTGKQQRAATACTLFCAHIGIFFMPFIVRMLETVAGTTALQAPYPIAGVIVSALLVMIMVLSHHKTFRKKVGLENDR